MRFNNQILLASVLALLLFISGCSSPSPPQTNTTSAPLTNTSPSAQIQSPPTQPIINSSCADKTCFISAVNDCQDIQITSSDDIGVFQYSSAKGCVFTKTLVTLNANESAEMKTLLQGKSFTCYFAKGKFDSRLVNSLLSGSENCDGELKDILAELMLVIG